VTKRERIAESILSRGPGKFPACYELFFSHFNAGEYYEAHDVLEHLWLDSTGPLAQFYKGLIQIAGGFVHLRLQFLRPMHPKDGRRLRPACRLLVLGSSNIRPFAPHHLGLDVCALCSLCEHLVHKIESSHFTDNPWNMEVRPQISISAE